MLLVHYYGVKNNYLFVSSLILIVFSFVTIIEINYNEKKRKDNIEKYYKNLQGFEKEIIEHCINNKILTYRTDPFDDDEYTTAIYSLVGKGFGRNISYGGDFIMYQEVYAQLLKLKAKK